MIAAGSRVWLCAAPIAAWALDSVLTLGGQTAAYWAGDFSQANEWNPWVRWCLAQHPAATVIAGAVWISLVCAAIIAMPGTWASVLSLWVVFLHGGGAALWISIGHGSYWLAVLTMLGWAMLVVLPPYPRKRVSMKPLEGVDG